ncbi:MAG: hypothetical protein OEZ10_06555 [Gammaproteobacteria bacterium]|nr:hypothetical protein [Gammaproteobacteria bacterium]
MNYLGSRYFPFFLSMTFFVGGPAFAEQGESWVFVPKVSASKKQMEFIDKTGSVDVGITTVTAELAFTAAYKQFYMSLSADESVNSTYELEAERELQSSRQDYALTFGYNIAGFNIFAGYKDGQSEISSKEIFTGELTDLTFRDNGPFLGFSYGYQMDKYGSIGANVAYAAMAGQLIRGSSVSPFILNLDGDTSGVSYGLYWSVPVNDSQVFSANLKSHRYQFSSDLIDYEQNFDILSLSLSSYF